MILAGKFSASGSDMFLCIYELKDTVFYVLVSSIHKDDMFKRATGEKLEHVEISDVNGLARCYEQGYVLEAIKRLKKSGKTESYGKPNVLLRVLDAISFAKSYKFSKADVVEESTDVDFGNEVDVFDASDDALEYGYEKVNGSFKYLRIKTNNISFELSDYSFKLPFNKLPFEKMQQQSSKKVMIATLKEINFDILNKMLDMSWYKKDGVLQKDYKSVKSKYEFETLIMTPIAKKIAECEREGKTFDIALDTETDGLFVYNLSKDNPNKNHCVAVPICWEFNHSNVIFTDMEHFDNVPNEYVAERLAVIFEKFDGERTLEYYDYTESGTKKMQSFGESVSDGKLVKKSIVFKRSTVNLIGHNSPFDGRVFFDLGKKFYFNNNTLQMAFDINPVTVRGSKKLKVLTRLFFHHETPELEDVLGKGNEDKYRYLSDEEVAKIYGCADADYTLAVFYKLRALMTDEMYYWYQKQDVPMDNILYQSEYWGMPTVEEKVHELAQQNLENIRRLKEAMYSYVGVYVQYTNEAKALQAAWLAGRFDSQEEYEQALASIKPDPNARYEFEFKPAQLRSVLYDIMKYPIKAYTEGKKRLPKIDKYAIKKLLQDELKEGDVAPRKLQEDILVSGATQEDVERMRAKGKKDKDNPYLLISSKEFNKLKYPLAMIIQKYAELNKEYTSYYKPMEETNLEGKIFKGYNMARIETRRISNPGQTMKGSLKAVIKPYSDDDYLLDFDMAQIEYRIMLSLSGFKPMIAKMCDPENDYHTETASMVEGKPAYRITKKERKKAKSVSFGVPYGLGDSSMCETMFGDRSKDHMVDTRITLHKWRESNKPIIDLLEKSRAEALTEWKINDDLRDFMGAWKKDENGDFVADSNGNKIPIPISKCENILHFYRTFSLEGIDLSEAGKERRAKGEFTPEEASIRRKAGNYPIQATAAEIFRIILIRFYNMCEEYGIQDKVKWYMLIHDELLCSVKNDVNPMLIYKIVKKACMITMKGHTKYFVGINMGDSWGECKDDAREAPVYFVERMIKRYEAGEFRDKKVFRHPWDDLIKPLRAKYVEDRIGEIITRLQPQFPKEPLDLKELLVQFTNYTVRAYVNDYPMNGEPSFTPEKGNSYQENLYEDLKWICRLETWALEHFEQPVKFKSIDGDVYRVTKVTKVEEEEDDFADVDDFDDMFAKDDEQSDDYWDFDEGSAQMIYDEEVRDESTNSYEEDELVFDYGNSNAEDVTAMTIVESKYKNLKVINNQVVVKVADYKSIDAVKLFLSRFVSPSGSRVLFKGNGIFDRWKKLSESFDVKNLDDFVEFLKNPSDVVSVFGDTVVITVNNVKQRNVVNRVLDRYSGTDMFVIFNDEKAGFVKGSSFSKDVSINKLTKMVNKILSERSM